MAAGSPFKSTGDGLCANAGHAAIPFGDFLWLIAKTNVRKPASGIPYNTGVFFFLLFLF